MDEKKTVAGMWGAVGMACFAGMMWWVGTGLGAEEARGAIRRATGVEGEIEVGGAVRKYRIAVPGRLPEGREVPLLVVFHGGGGNAAVASRMGFSELAEREGIIVLYPEARGGNWNDGRTGELIVETAGENDDVGFVMALIGKIGGEYRIDAGRIYATGFSNGGMMSHRMGIEKAEVFAAIAPVIGGIAKELATPEKFRPSEPVSVMVVQGTEDPLVPYGGGKVAARGILGLGGGRGKDRGEIVSTDEAVGLWKEANGIGGEAERELLPDRDPDDGCRIETVTYPAGKNGSRLVLVRMVGAGHTVPGGAQYLPERVIGKTCRDVGGVELIWGFFEGIRKRG